MDDRNEQVRKMAEAMGINSNEVDKFVDDTKKYSESYDSFVIPDNGDKVFATFESDEVRGNIQTKFGMSSVTTVFDDNGVKYTYWLSPGSIAAREYMRQRIILGKAQKTEIGSIANKRFAFWKTPITTAKYGEVNAIRMQLQDDDKQTDENKTDETPSS